MKTQKTNKGNFEKTYQHCFFHNTNQSLIKSSELVRSFEKAQSILEKNLEKKSKGKEMVFAFPLRCIFVFVILNVFQSLLLT